MKDDYLQLSPFDFLATLLRQIEEKEDVLLSFDDFLSYARHHSIWENDNYDVIFYTLYDYIDERIPRRVYSISDLKEDIEGFLKKKKA